MAGTLYFDGDRPPIGTKVLIIVDAVNNPTGMWDGELVQISEEDHPVLWRGIDHLKDAHSVTCIARITDPRAQGQKGEPHLNYTVYTATSGTQYLRSCLAEAKIEIRGLKNRMDIERGVWHAMLKAIVSPDAFVRLEKLLDEFATRLGR